MIRIPAEDLLIKSAVLHGLAFTQKEDQQTYERRSGLHINDHPPAFLLFSPLSPFSKWASFWIQASLLFYLSLTSSVDI